MSFAGSDLDIFGDRLSEEGLSFSFLRKGRSISRKTSASIECRNLVTVKVKIGSRTCGTMAIQAVCKEWGVVCLFLSPPLYLFLLSDDRIMGRWWKVYFERIEGHSFFLE
ncbi:hypothetical protein TNCT_564051 [Trichonephila clavata]|uniref:Uncharacterized protein n=1 Tax=Trichonephila clavata TaxID=2740835 RepID=A0A8X6G8B9_TRICU|nr:hypothetical protein TNCT_564051 [Trichonephila clavata]